MGDVPRDIDNSIENTRETVRTPRQDGEADRLDWFRDDNFAVDDDEHFCGALIPADDGRMRCTWCGKTYTIGERNGP